MTSPNEDGEGEGWCQQVAEIVAFRIF